jgi:hypothetical protein
MPKITKAAKPVRIEYEEVKRFLASYQCPSCLVFFKGFGPAENVIRFRCQCGQELVVER